MNSDFDREIDRLLRGGGAAPRGAPAPTPGNGRDSADAADGAHLDADELSAYAENALPDAARTRFVAHLADCDRCRKIATTVALSSGAAAELERRGDADAHAVAASALAESSSVKSRLAETRSATWRERLAALLSPRVLRFAAPALAICVVGAVAFVALRQSPRSITELARQTGTQQRDNASSAPEAETQTTTATTAVPGEQTPPAAANANTAANTNANVAATREESVAVTQERKAAEADAPPAATTTAAEAAPPAPAPVIAKAAEDNDALAARDEARKDGPPEPTRNEAVSVAKEGQQQDRDDVSRTYAGAANSTNVQSAPKASPSRRGGGGEEQQTLYEQQSRQRGSDGREMRQQRSAPQREQESETRPATRAPRARAEAPAAPPRAMGGVVAPEQTRSVGGRQFRRRGNAWVDTEYRSQRLITHSRGSEGYRSLVADAPHIGNIARDLPGEIIVVWNNRAYRIR